MVVYDHGLLWSFLLKIRNTTATANITYPTIIKILLSNNNALQTNIMAAMVNR